MDGSAPFGGWDAIADAAYDAAFDTFSATIPDHKAVAQALEQLESIKTIKRHTHRDLIVSPQRLMQANPAIASQVQTFLTAGSTNDGAVLFGQDIAEAVAMVPVKPRSNLTRKERHIEDRQELLLQRERAEAAEQQLRDKDEKISELEVLLARYDCQDEMAEVMDQRRVAT